MLLTPSPVVVTTVVEPPQQTLLEALLEEANADCAVLDEEQWAAAQAILEVENNTWEEILHTHHQELYHQALEEEERARHVCANCPLSTEEQHAMDQAMDMVAANAETEYLDGVQRWVEDQLNPDEQHQRQQDREPADVVPVSVPVPHLKCFQVEWGLQFTQEQEPLPGLPVVQQRLRTTWRGDSFATDVSTSMFRHTQ